MSGAVIRNSEGKTVFKCSKKQKIVKEEIEGLIGRLLSNNFRSPINKLALDTFIAKLDELIAFFEKVNTRYFISSSLFFIYSDLNKYYDIKFIDFAHVGPVDVINTAWKRDENFLKGLKSVYKHLSVLQKKVSSQYLIETTCGNPLDFLGKWKGFVLKKLEASENNFYKKITMKDDKKLAQLVPK